MGKPQYLFDRWTTEQGLPQNSVLTFAQTPDGYFWLTTWDGLVRFDGMAFELYDAATRPELGNGLMLRVHVAADGALWVGTDKNYVIRWHNGRFTRYDEKAGVPSKGIATFANDRAGNLWAASRNQQGVFKLENGKFVEKAPASRFGTYEVWQLPKDEKGDLWAASGVHLTRLDPPDFKRVGFQGVGPGDLRGLAEGKEGIWGCSALGVSLFRNEAWELRAAFPRGIKSPGAMCQDRSGVLWVGTWEDGLWMLSPDGEFRQAREGTRGAVESYRHILEDVEGNLWLGTDGHGLLRARERRFTIINQQAGLSRDIIKTVSGDSSNVWVSTHTGVDRLNWREGKMTRIVDRLVWSGIVDRNGTFWYGGYGNGVFRYDPDGTFTECRLGGLKWEAVNYALWEALDRTIWLGTSKGIARIETNSVVMVPTPGFTNFTEVKAIAENRAGDLFFGSSEHGIAVRSAKETWSFINQKNGLPGSRIGSLYCDANDTLWIGVNGFGLSRLSAHGELFTYPEPEIPMRIRGIVEDDHGHMWLAGAHGVYRASKEKLERRANGEALELLVSRFGTSDGLGTSECASGIQPTTWKAPDGKIWFATLEGVAIVDPSRITQNSRPPPVVIQRVFVDGLPADVSNGAVRIPAGSHRLDVQYGALSYIDPARVRFRYRLKGFDESWTEAGNRRAVYFTKLPAGEYTLEIIACNNDGVWNERGASLAVARLPSYWETNAFRMSAAAAVLLLALWVHDRRVRRLKQAQALQESFSRQLLASQEQERKRIAAELHDSVGQGLLVIKNRAALALDSESGAELPKELEEISGLASQTLEEVRAISHNLRPYQLDHLGLARAIKGMLSHVSQSSPVEFEADIERVDGLLSPEAEINFYRTLQEAVNNVVKHSGAAKARVHVRTSNGHIYATVQDFGRGFSRDGIVSLEELRGFGLSGIAERVKILGGALEIESALGRGSKIELRIPTTARP